MSITPNDLNDLIREPSAKVRAQIAEKVSKSFNRSYFTANENRIAIDIFRLLLRDTAISVRKAIAQNLKDNVHVPRDIIIRLASDEADVAVSVIEHSLVLTDEDLVEIIHATNEIKKWLAVSRRNTVSQKVSTHLIATHHQDVVVSLLNNKGSHIAAVDVELVINEFRHDQNVLESLVCRGGLSGAYAERLYSLVSDRLKKQLTKRYRLPWNIVSEQADIVRETAILSFLSSWMDHRDIEELVDQMYRNKRLSWSMVIRALCMGEIEFFEVAMARMVGIPIDNARKMLGDQGPLGFRMLYESSEMPENLFDAVRATFQMVQHHLKENTHKANLGQRLIEHIKTNGYDHSIENMSYILSILRQGHHDARILH